jgi:uncharacterized protein (TIGR03437 family)
VRTNLSIVMLLAAAALCPAARAQSVSGVRVFSNAPNARFFVDGGIYYGSATFLWPEGSKHFVAAEPQDSSQWGMRYEYGGWANNLGDSDSTGKKAITAGPDLKWVQLNFSVSYLLTVSATPECAAGVPCPAPGRVESPCGIVSNETVTCFSSGGRFAAYPGSGAIFSRWVTAIDLSPQSASSYLINLTLTGPTSLTALFMPAAAAQSEVTVQTDPQELTVIVDGTVRTPPVSFEWGWGTAHTVGTEPLQRSRGVAYAFESWSDGGAINHEVRVPSPSQPINLVARFVPAHTVQFQTSPSDLRLNIDGQAWVNHLFGWAPGSKHAVSAPETQTDAQGRRYRFVQWSNGKSASFDYIAGPAGPEIRLVAMYQLLGQATIASNPSGLPIELDGAACVTPCRVERDAGATIRFAAAGLQKADEQSRLLFKGWSDSAAPARAVELTADPRTYTANYIFQSRLSLSAAPVDGANMTVDPSSSDGFYDTGSVVSVIATPALGFRIRTWSGDLTGSGARAAIAIDAPRTAVLLLDRVPVIAPLGVRNAATGALPGRVAAGSLISIIGANLAAEPLSGPVNPLAQTLGSVTVRVGASFLPLLFVSPGQINAQLVSGLPPGIHTLALRVGNAAETSLEFEVARNAPGLFSAAAVDPSLGAFFRAGGEAVTPEKPAHPGEIVAILATGLGPYRETPPDGFSVEESSAYSLMDAVEVVAGGQWVVPLYAGRTGAVAGVDVVRFAIPSGATASGLLEVRVIVNGRESNPVTLPVVIP